MEMVERVARAIWADSDEDRPEWEWLLNHPDPEFAATAEHYRSVARTAIEAMREPTPEMVEAACLAFSGYNHDFESLRSRMEEVLPAAIDAALPAPPASSSAGKEE